MVQKKACSGVVEIPTSASRPMITLPVKPTDEGLFKGEASPGPLTLVSSFFPEKEFGAECSSISQLLAGGMSSPGFASIGRPAEAGGLRFKLGNPLASPQSSFVTIPTGISPTTLLDSPVLRPPTSVGEAPFGISHQQALAHDTAQVVQHESQIQSANEEASIVDSDPEQRVSSSNTDQIGNNPAETHFSTPKENPPSHKVAPDQPLNDGYQWKKYGQKEVKGSKFPRSYYKCKNSTCPVKKTVERSLDGEVTEIIYKGQHNHAQPRPSGCEKDGVNGGLDMESEMGGDGFAGKINRGDETLVGYTKTNKRQGLTGEESSVMSKGGGGADNSSRLDEGDDNEHDTKRRVVDSATVTQTTASNRTHTEPRLILETTSEIDLLDDGYRWRKYGQKVVKGNPHPRSYYKCTNNGCTIRKHVERSPTDPKAVITTYEGKHNHDAPVAASKVGNHHAESIQTSIIN